MKLDYLFAKLLYPESKELPDIDLCICKFNKEAFQTVRLLTSFPSLRFTQT